ncbi:hypothetical protein P20480_3219 [Pseudoalteromonas sp. BSi20480]|nr:hypothetical protein P20480_3219 [Pseudoalteromonas sp. BSi20480]
MWLLACKNLSMFKPPTKNNTYKKHAYTGGSAQQCFKFIDIIEATT